MNWSGRLPPRGLFSLLFFCWRSGGEGDDGDGGFVLFCFFLERSWVSSASPPTLPPRDGGERTTTTVRVREAGGGGCWHEEGRVRWASRALKAFMLVFLLFLFCLFVKSSHPPLCSATSTLGQDVELAAAALFLARLHAQLLPVGRLVGLRLGAGVGAAVERRHGAAFGVGVKAAVGRRVAGLELSWALHLLQSADCTQDTRGGRSTREADQRNSR